MSYEEHKEIKAALEELHRWLRVEGDPPKPAALARELVKISRSGGVARGDILTAAFSLHGLGLPATAGNVAWLVRDASIGYPPAPSFDF